MKKTKDIKIEEKEILEIISKEDALEFRRIATGRKFCKKGEMIIDICLEELKRYEYENSKNPFIKIFKQRKIKKSREKLLIENRECSNIRAIARTCIENQELEIEELITNVKKIILDCVEKYENENK